MRRPRGNRYAALALVTFSLACGGDAPTAPNATQETVRVSLVGLGGNDAGVVLQLIGAISHVESAGTGLDVGWVVDGTSSATVVVVGPLSESVDVLIVRRPTRMEPLRAEVRELADAHGAVVSSSTTRAIVRAGAAP